MPVTFLHTADWQLGKPYGWVVDATQQVRLQEARFAVIDRLGEIAREHGASFMLVAGDLFDSNTPGLNTVNTALGKIGNLIIPVLVIPGNHDHGGTGSLWEPREFLQQRDRLAPNLRVLLRAEPVEVDGAVIFPCPLLKRMEIADTTAWVGAIPPEELARFGTRARIVLAHGSVQGFVSDDGDGEAPNQINLDRLPPQSFDYIALGDWHGTKKVAPHAWYSGTPEVDRFPKGPANRPGHCLVVNAGRGGPLEVLEIASSLKAWRKLRKEVGSVAELETLVVEFREMMSTRVNEDLLELDISGSLGLEGQERLELLLDEWRPSVLALEVKNTVTIAPTQEEVNALTHRATDPLIKDVACRLLKKTEQGGDEGEMALAALRDLYTFANRV